jgi:arylsulfatase A-like enzyme/Tfp pilus assembly protein PilF
VVVLAVIGVGFGCRQSDQVEVGEVDQVEVLGGVETNEINVVLVTIDTLRADRVSSYGSGRVATPHMDRIAAEGILFSNAASTVPFTLPAHASIMTGAYPPRHGVRENVGYTLNQEMATLAEEMGKAGRDTSGFVSAFVLDSRWGIGRGFAHFFDDFDLGALDSPNLSSVQRSGEETVAAAVRWLDERESDQPFFLWLHLYDPHDPYTPPEPYKSRFPAHPYDGEVAYTDAIFGDFLDALVSRGLLDRSLFILTADHGEGLGDHQEAFHGYFVYDTTIRVPLMVRFPGTMYSGRVISDPVSHVDLMPTILDVLNRPIPGGVDGKSLLPVIAGAPDSTTREVYSESFYPLLHYGWAPLRSIRTDRYKLIDVPRAELYDLKNDSEELNDVFREQREIADELTTRLKNLRMKIESNAPTEASPSDLDQETIDRLRALGYMAGGGGVSVEDEGEKERADPKDRIELHQMIMVAQSRMGKGEKESSKRLLERVLEIDGEIVDAHQMLGQIASIEQDFNVAAGHFQHVLAVDESHTKALFGLARAYEKLGRKDEAAVGFRRVLEISGRDIRATSALADIYIERQELDEAGSVLDDALDQPDPPAFLLNKLGELRALQGQTVEAQTLFERAISRNDKLAEPHFNLAVLHEEDGDWHEAVQLYEDAIERAPRHFQAHFNLGRLYGQLGQLDRQQWHWEAAIESNPTFVRGYFYLAKLLMDTDQNLNRAEELTRQGIAKDSNFVAGPLGYFLLADLLNRAGKPAEARQAVEKAKEIQAAGG